MIKLHNIDIVGTALQGVEILSHTKYSDNRGWFSQQWTTTELVEKYGFRTDFVQCNCAYSKRGVLRGMHRQNQTKLLTVLNGTIFDAVYDPDTKNWMGVTLTEGSVILVPAHYAHGYFVLSEDSLVQYLVDRPWNTSEEEIFAWDKCGIDWPTDIPVIVSARDAQA